MDCQSSSTSSSAGSGGVRTDHPPKAAKRARLHPNDATFKSSNEQIGIVPGSTSSKEKKKPLALLPIDLLASSLLYLDVGDVPSASAVCRDWRAAVHSVEDELWLGLVRRHCPSVEEVTNLLELTSETEAMAGDDGDRGRGRGHGSGIPSPSRSWRRQYQRHWLLNQSDGSAAVSAKKQPPKPLSAYFFQVDLVLYQKTKGVTGKGEQIGVVTRVFPVVKFDSSNNCIQFKFDKMCEDMKNYTFSAVEFEFRVTIFDKSTGRQALVHCGGLEDVWDHNEWSSDYYPLACAYALEDLVDPDEHIESMLLVRKTGCASRCNHEWEFEQVPACSCCKCDGKWSCFWDMEIKLRIAAYFDWDPVQLDEAQQLRFFEEHLEFK